MIELNVYKNGARHVLTLSYDDGHVQDRRLVEILDRYGVRGTFNLNSGTIGRGGIISAEEIKSLYKNHEVAVHAVHHPWLERITRGSMRSEIIEDRKSLEQYCGYPVRGMAYPFGTYNDEVIDVAKSCGIVYARTADGTGSFNLPQDFMRWTGTCHHRQCLEYAPRFISNLGSVWFSGVFYVWGHSFEFENDNNWDLIERFCEQVAGRSEVWYATNIELYDYIMAGRQLQVSVDESIVHNPTAMDLWIKKDGEVVKIAAGSTLRF